MQLPLPDDAIPYVVLVFNSILFLLARRVGFASVPEQWRLLVSEIISTLELCSDCAELGVVYERHGTTAYAATLLIVCFWWCQVFNDAEACPCGPIEECILQPQLSAADNITQKLLGQAIGGAATAGYTQLIWSLHLIPEHRNYNTAKECLASLQVPMLWGAVIEGIITFISRLVALYSVRWATQISAIANSITTVVLVVAALNTTGGFFNPILASSLTLGCKGNTLTEHGVVYWVGALLGGFIARVVYNTLQGEKEKLF